MLINLAKIQKGFQESFNFLSAKMQTTKFTSALFKQKMLSPRCIIQRFQRLESKQPGRVAQSVGHLTPKSGVLGSILGLATYFRFSFRFFKKGSCQLLAKVCARSTG